MGDTRVVVLHYVRDHPGARPKEISDGLGLDYELTKKTCSRMVKDGQLETDGKGRHFLPHAAVPAVPGVPAAGQTPFRQGQQEGHQSPTASDASERGGVDHDPAVRNLLQGFRGIEVLSDTDIDAYLAHVVANPPVEEVA